MATQEVANGPTTAIILQGVQATPVGKRRGAEYRIYLNLPTSQAANFNRDELYVGAVNTFVLSDHPDAHPQNFIFPINDKIAASLRAGLMSPNGLRVSLVSAEPEGREPLITIQAVRVIVSNSPL